ncbi:hypothetical protein HMPREF1981_01500 [Bacteroides pyogenes F0041]|uniref:Uncharacterized protein n=1 Tax=Bacteroides pyogenes F0041 TaxID=1321819 RepID=U2CM71_9BACE|nr:hypothetical protein HMPREF1981_01500 [Bacteroides pyogenes F0041]
MERRVDKSFSIFLYPVTKITIILFYKGSMRRLVLKISPLPQKAATGVK